MGREGLEVGVGVGVGVGVRLVVSGRQKVHAGVWKHRFV